MSLLNTNIHPSNIFSYDINPLGNDDKILIPFDKYKEQTIKIDKNYNNRHSEIILTKHIDHIKEMVKKSHGYLNYQFLLIDYLSKNNSK